MPCASRGGNQACARPHHLLPWRWLQRDQTQAPGKGVLAQTVYGNIRKVTPARALQMMLQGHFSNKLALPVGGSHAKLLLPFSLPTRPCIEQDASIA